MKKFTLGVLAIVLTFSLSAGEIILQGKEASSRMEGAELLRYKNDIPHPVFVKFANGQGPEVNSAANWIVDHFNWPDGYSLSLHAEEVDRLGWTNLTFKQQYQGIPVELAVIKVHVLNGRVISISGYSSAAKPEASHQLSEGESLNGALNKISAKTYKWEVASEEALIKQETGDANATYFPKGEKVFLPKEVNFSTNEIVPCWKFNVYAQSPLYRADVYVDATTGNVIFENQRIKHADSVCTAMTSFSGLRTIITDYTGNGNFRMRENGRGNGVQTYDMLNGTSHGGAVDLVNNSNYWPDTLRLRFATDAHWGAELVYDYYMNNHGRNSINGNGFTLRSYVHYGVNYSNAFWDGQRMTYGDGTSSTQPYTTLDIAGHEISHGLTEFTADLVYSYESGALNESFSDIFGCAVEIVGKPDPVKNWQMGEDRGSYLRSMSNPKVRQDPDTYNGQYWYVGTADNGGVHTNSGVQNHWFYLLTQGGTGSNDNSDAYNVVGLGITKAEAITFRNLTVYLSSTSDYEDARFYSIQSAIDLYGTCTAELASTVNAWYAVGLGDEYAATVISDFSANVTESCNIPTSVVFTNLSNYNANSYLWDFGDSTTSTIQDPLHVYTKAGSYTVKLTATGNGICGSNLLTRTSYIQIAPPDEVQAPAVTTCDGLSAKLVAYSNDSVYWFENVTTKTPLHAGKIFITPNLFTDTTFYAQSIIPSTAQNVGPASNAFGGGGNFNNYQYQIFNVYKNLTLKTVKVYASGSKNRTIQLRDSSGGVLQTKVVYIEDGEQTVTLDFAIAPGTDYQLGVATGSTPDLYRNNSGASYPYSIAGLMEITRSSANTTPLDYYYFYYDWMVQGEDCEGARIPVSVTLDYDVNCVPFYAGIDNQKSLDELTIFPNPSSGNFIISFELNKGEQIKLNLMDSKGSLVNSKNAQFYEAGQHQILWDGTKLTKGLYLMQVESGATSFLKRIVVE